MNAIKILFHFILITIVAVGCSRNDKELTKIKVQESINKQVLLAKEYLTNGNNSQAISLLESIEKKYPTDLTILETLGFVHKESGNPILAATYFEKLVNQSESSPEYQIFAAQAYMDAKNYCEACRNFNSYLEVFPTDRSTWKLLSQAYELDKKDSLALDAYLHLEKLSPSKLKEKDLLKIAHLSQKSKKIKEAHSRYQQILKNNPKSLEARVKLLKLEIHLENWKEVQNHLTKLENLPSEKIDQAFIQSVKDILIKKPKSSKSANHWHQQALASMKNKDWINAEIAAQEALKLEPDNILYTFNYLKIIKAKDSDTILLEELKKAKTRFSQNADIMLALAQTQHKIDGHMENAKPLYEEFLIKAPNHTKSEQVKKLLTAR